MLSLALPDDHEDIYPQLGSAKFELEAQGVPWTLADEFYVQQIKGQLIVSAHEEDHQESQGGTIELLNIRANEAANDEMDPFDVCDSHSDWLVEMYKTIFEDGTWLARVELDVEPSFNDVLVLWDLKIKEEFNKGYVAISALEVAIKTFGSTSLIVAVNERLEGDLLGLKLTDEEWMRLGFVNVYGSQFMIRDTGKQNPYLDDAGSFAGNAILVVGKTSPLPLNWLNTKNGYRFELN